MKPKKQLPLIIIPLTVITIVFTGCLRNPVLSSLPSYDKAEEYFEDGFQDYTDYAKYYYSNINADDFSENEFFACVTKDDIDNINSYVDNFHQAWTDFRSDSLNDFDYSIDNTKEGDYFYIDTLEGEEIGDSYYGKFDDYTLYYFDLEDQILYYFHTNI